jgi:hypothetical protein
MEAPGRYPKMECGFLHSTSRARLIGEHLSLELFGVTRFACWHDVSFLSDSSALAVHNLGVTSGTCHATSAIAFDKSI